MKILQVVHSFLPYTMAGTEVYSYKLSKELARNNEVSVFFRINDPRLKEYTLEQKEYEGLNTYALNHTFRHCKSFRQTYQDENIDKKFAELLDKINPDVVHIHHLLFLSFGMVGEIKKRKIPLIYTLHDYWLLCYRGQLIKETLKTCNYPAVNECNECLKYLLSIQGNSLFFYNLLKKKIPASLLNAGKKLYLATARSKTTNAVEVFQKSTQELFTQIDLFLAPSYFIREKFISQGLKKEKIIYSPYGFDLNNFTALSSEKSSKLRFGFLGTLLPMKGVDLLISAFKEIMDKNIELSIYGKLFSYVGFESFPNQLKKVVGNDPRIFLRGGYDNKDVGKILSKIDVLVVPSLWFENSPLVIQEAFLAHLPVVAARIGGIPEMIKDGLSGLLFNAGDKNDLKEKLEYLIHHPEMIKKFKENIPGVKSIEEDARRTQEAYQALTRSPAMIHQ
ncbi:MAG: glycosyltransferase family 4 protein [Candidatus Omnitrophica bacterium]|nr:glycosyltransferase family 4 protein [Candidatus Omnitrophota bacterium]